MQVNITPTASAAPLVAYNQQAAAGIVITAGGANQAPTGTFALDPQTQSDLAGIASTIAFTGGFPGGGATFTYPDITGLPANQKTFPSVAAFRSFYAAYVALVLQQKQVLATLQAGGTASWPSNQIALS
jgi:hypothetical protein